MTDKTYDLALVRGPGGSMSVYLNDYRIAGGKPWGGGTVERTWKVRPEHLATAVPELRATGEGK